MAVQIITDGDLFKGAAVVEASDGTKLSITVDTSDNIEIYSDIDGTPNLEDSDTAATVFGGGAVSFLHAAIDSSDNIHIVAACLSEQTRDVAYCIATESAGSWTLGTWEEVADFTTEAPVVERGISISIDSNDKPHVGFVDAVKQQGTTRSNVYYTEKTGASWATPTQIGERASKNDTNDWPAISMKASDDIEILWRSRFGGIGGTYAAYRTYTGTWTDQDELPIGGANTIRGLTIESDETVHRAYIEEDAPKEIHEDGSYTGYNANSINSDYISVVAVDDVRYIFFCDSSDDIHLISNDGGGWIDEGAIQTGTYDFVIAEWAYNNENQSGEINYIFEASGTVYYDSFSLGEVARRIFITHV